MKSLTYAVLATFLAASIASAQGKLWIVNQSGGAGVDFTDIQPAVDAASDGDTILIQQGFSTYGSFTIDGKALVVTEDVLSDVRTFVATVKNLASHQSVTLRGFDPFSVNLDANQGPILLEDVGQFTILGGFLCGFGFGPAGSSTQRLLITSCDAVVLSRCIIGGALGLAPGITVQSSTVHMYEVETKGSTPSGLGSSKGGAGVLVVDSFLFASGSTFLGGCGQSGDSFPFCASGGDGGVGLAESNSVVHLLEVKLEGGAGGPGGLCAPGSPGLPFSGFFSLVAGNARDYTITAVASGGSTAAIHYEGVSGDLVLSVIALDLAPLFLVQHAGTLVVAIPPILITHGIASGGTLDTTVPLPPLPPGLEALPIYAQGAAISPVGAAVLAAPSQLTIL